MNNDNTAKLMRVMLGIVLPLSLVALTVLPLAVFRDRLPEPLATHWGWAGRANDSMRFTVLLLFDLVFAGTPAAGMAFVANRNPAYRGEIAPAVTATAFMAALVAAASWWVVGANLDVTDWSEAVPVSLSWHGLGLVSAVAVASVALIFARSIETEKKPEPVVPTAGLKDGVRAFWVGTARAAWAFPLMVVLVTLGIVMAFTLHPLLALPFVLVGLSALSFSSIRVVADRFGVRIEYGPLGWPTQRVRLEDIRRASGVHVVPLQRGGWGYRGSLRIFRRATILLRGGDGIELELSGGRVLTITVDDAREGAGLINDLIDIDPSDPVD